MDCHVCDWKGLVVYSIVDVEAEAIKSSARGAVWDYYEEVDAWRSETE